MRRKDRELTEEKQILEIIKKCKVCRLAVQDRDGLYLVPLNFGYAFDGGNLTLYFHSAKEGRKMDALQENPKVCFEMDCEHALIEADSPCGYGYEFASVIGNGTAEIIEDAGEKIQALSLLMQHQTGKMFTFTEQMAESAAVIKVTAYSFTAKMCKR